MEILKLYVAHFVADFMLQTRAVAEGKGKKWRYWLLHGLLLTLTTLVVFGRQVPELCKPLAASILWHVLVDLCTSRWLRPSLAVLLIDQTVHLISLPLILLAYGIIPWEKLAGIMLILDDPGVLTVILGYAFSLFFGSVFVERICERFSGPPAVGEDNECLRRETEASRFIGLVERFLVTTFIFYGQYGAVGYVFAAKSLGKFAESSESAILKRFPAYYLVGTLASLAVAVLAGLFMRWQLSGSGL